MNNLYTFNIPPYTPFNVEMVKAFCSSLAVTDSHEIKLIFFSLVTNWKPFSEKRPLIFPTSNHTNKATASVVIVTSKICEILGRNGPFLLSISLISFS